MRRLQTSLFCHTLLAAALAPALALLSAAPLTAQAAPAAARSESIWLEPRAEAPMSARAPLIIELRPAEGPCRSTYGSEWAEKCRIALGHSGALAQGIQLSPQIAGSWRWLSRNTLAFEPRDAWEPGRRLRVSLIGLPVPLRASITSSPLTIETPPLTAVFSRAQVLIDPRDDARRAAAVEFGFTTAVSDAKRAELEKNFSIELPEGADVQLGAPVFIWSDDRTNLYVRVPVIRLAEDPVMLMARLPGAAAKTVQKNGRFTVHKGFEAAGAQTLLPGLATLFQVTGASAELVKDDGLNAEYEITLSTSLAVSADEALKALRILALPEKLDGRAAAPTAWTAAPVIDEEVLSRAVPIEAHPSGSHDASRVRLRLKAAPGTYLYLGLAKGFGPQGKAGLAEDWSTVLSLPEPGAEIAFLQPGNLLTLAGSWELSLYASGVETLKWRIARIRDEFLALASDGWNSAQRAAPESWLTAVTGETPLGSIDPANPGAARFAALDLSEAVMAQGPGLYQIEIEGIRERDGKSQTVARTQKRVLLTNIAMIAKTSADGALDLFAASFADGKPAAGLQASLIARNGTVLAKTQTDASGRAHFDSLRGWEREREPIAAALRSRGTDLAWISLADPAAEAETFRWDVGGRRTGGSGLAALAFSDRGIYRAGETAHFGIALRETNFAALPEGTPALARITNDAGRVLDRRTLKLTAEGLASFDWKIPEGELPGRLRLDIFAGGDESAERDALASASLFVGDFAPETLSLSAELPQNLQKAGWAQPEDIPIDVSLRSLFGAGAEGRRAEGEISVTPLAEAALPGWEGWRFPSPAAGLQKPLDHPRTLPIASAQTAGTGKAVLHADLSGLSLSGFADVHVSLTGTEAEGSAAVERSLSFLAFPGDTALGWRLSSTPQPAWFLLTGQPAEMELAAVGQDLRARPGERIRVTIEKTRWITELTEDSSGRLVYADAPVSDVRQTLELVTGEEGTARLPLLTGEPGLWLVRAEREDGTLLLTVPYSTAGGRLEDFASGDLPASELRARLEKTDLEAGSTARLSLLSPIRGFALASFESAGVISAQWVNVDAGENLIELPVPENFSGRAWLRFSLVRSQDDAKKFLKGFAETALPVSIGISEKKLGLTVAVPEKTADSRSIPVTITADRPAKVFVWAADDGILSLTGWKTPDPVRALLLDRALEVETREMLSLLMPDAGALKGLIQSPAGGDFAESAKAAAGFGNPFRRSFGPSAVWWGGMVDAGPEPVTLEMTLPEGFAGRVRVSAAGASAGEAGSAFAAAAVAPDLAISPILPAAVSPGDRFRAGAVTTPNVPAASGTLTIAPPEAFGAAAAELPLAFSNPGGISASADFTVPQDASVLGSQRFVFRAEAASAVSDASAAPEAPEAPKAPDASGAPQADENADAAPAAQAAPAVPDTGTRLTAERTETLSVRPASVWQERLYGGRLEHTAGKTAVSIPTETYPQESSTRFVASVTPAVLVSELARPFMKQSAWTEVSSRIAASLPELLLALSPDAAALLPQSALTADPEAAKAALDAAAARRTAVYGAIKSNLARGGLKALPWSQPSVFLSAFALDYLTDAQRTDPAALEPLARLRERLLAAVSTDPATLDEARTSAYALWALTREGTMVTPQLEALRASMVSRFDGWERDAAAAFLAASYKRMRLHDEAEALLGGTLSTARAAGDWTPETAAALAAAALSETELGGTPAGRFLASIAAEDLSRAFRQGIVTPVYAAAAARAAMTPETGGLTASESAGGSPDLVCSRRAEGFPADRDRLVLSGWGAILDAPGCLEAEISGMPDSSWIWWQAEQSGYERLAPGKTALPVRSGLEAEREFLDASGKPSTVFRAGDRVTVRVRLKSFAGENALTDIALTDLLPGGFTWAMPPGTGPEAAREFRRGEDRIQWLAPELTSWDPLTFTYTVRASYPGVFAAAPLTAESLSNPGVHARTAGSTIEIRAGEDAQGTPPRP